MKEWFEININGIAKIEKCVAEFYVWELKMVPHAKFKVKILEESKGGKYAGKTNLQLKNIFDDTPEAGVGFGDTITEALENTINNFMEMLSERNELTDEDFEYSDPDDF